MFVIPMVLRDENSDKNFENISRYCKTYSIYRRKQLPIIVYFSKIKVKTLKFPKFAFFHVQIFN